MENYIDLLRNIVKNFKYSNEFDDIIKRILDKIFNNYYVNREKHIYNIDNLYKKYDISKYNLIKKKYGISKKEDFEIILNNRICFYPPCLNKIIGTYNYCYLHNKDSV